MPPTPQERAAFGGKLKDLRKARGWTIQRVVDGLRDEDPSLSVAKVSAWERGEYAPGRPALVDMLERFFDVPGQLHAILATPPPPPDRFEELERRVRRIEEHLGLGQADATVTRLPAHRDPAELAAAADGPAESRGTKPSRQRRAKPTPPPIDPDDLPS